MVLMASPHGTEHPHGIYYIAYIYHDIPTVPNTQPPPPPRVLTTQHTGWYPSPRPFSPKTLENVRTSLSNKSLVYPKALTFDNKAYHD